jgi:hypothetical protein
MLKLCKNYFSDDNGNFTMLKKIKKIIYAYDFMGNILPSYWAKRLNVILYWRLMA